MIAVKCLVQVLSVLPKIGSTTSQEWHFIFLLRSLTNGNAGREDDCWQRTAFYLCIFFNNPAYDYGQQYSFDHGYDNDRNLDYYRDCE